MAVITTKSVGISDQSDPKPVRGFDYAGQPIPEGGYYNGRPEHSAPRVAAAAHARKHKRKRLDAEARKALSARLRAYWKARKEQEAETPDASAN